MTLAKGARSEGHAAEDVSALRLLKRNEVIEEERIESSGKRRSRGLVNHRHQFGRVRLPAGGLQPYPCAVMAKIVTLPSQFVVPVKLRIPYV